MWLFHTLVEISLNGDFPDGLLVKNPPSNAGDMGSIPGWGTKIPHAMGQRGLHTPTREAPAPPKRPSVANNNDDDVTVTKSSL